MFMHTVSMIRLSNIVVVIMHVINVHQHKNIVLKPLYI